MPSTAARNRSSTRRGYRALAVGVRRESGYDPTMLPGQSMGQRRARDVAAAARRLARARPEVRFPRWYLRRWHFLPEGYLSDRSVLLYERAVRAFYNAGMEP